MKVCCLASGSAGNCTYIESNNCKVLIDLGISTTDVENRLAGIGVEPASINAILITHEHIDHIGGIVSFIKKYPNVTVFAHENAWPAILRRAKIPERFRMAFFDNDFIINDLVISAFRLSHDSVMCVGYSLSADGQKISIATDTGYVADTALNVMLGSDIIVLESNHNENMLINNPQYSPFLKRRIMSNRGHLSNCECGNTIARLYAGGTSQYILAHLSQKNNQPRIAYDEVCATLNLYGLIEGKSLFVDVAFQDKCGHLFEIDPS